MKKQAVIWIENNPNTGEIKPWEVWFQVEDYKTRIASCQTESNARKSMEKAIKRNSIIYDIKQN